MKRLSISQRKTLAEFFTNGAVAWFTLGIATPIISQQPVQDAIISIGLGIIFTEIFLETALRLTRGSTT